MNLRLRTRAMWPLAIAFLASSLCCQDLWAQTPGSQAMLLDSAREIMAMASSCVLATSRDSEAPGIRQMDPFPPEADMTVWLGTNRNSRKVKEIARNPKVSLFYSAPGGSGYVIITGKAVLVDDPKEKASRWKPAWEAFYADRAAEFILIKVVAERLEILDFRHGIVGDPATWEAPSIRFQ
jgi:general stress protein 26